MKSRSLAAFVLAGSMAQLTAELSYNRDVLPIFAEHCFACHGVDKAQRKAELRLDRQTEAYAERDGVRAIVPGAPDQSELVSRVFSDDPDRVMPPPEQAERPGREELEILKLWIAEGARYERHWAFEPPNKRELPPVAGRWANNAIDRFVYARMTEMGLQPQEPARKTALIRRVSIDLTGLPPTLQEVDAFLSDPARDAYEKVVDRLLASPRFGERMAVWWLDGARYGDSHGFDNDLENAQWPWRNWVIDAFNDNKPFDVFTTEQLAGDLLPDASDDQVLATGFNRNHRIQTEDGAIDEEWRTEYVIDRVETMGAVWLGLSLNCARCHDHKYDPVEQREFYQLFALFDDIDEEGFINNLRGSAEPRTRYRPTAYEAAKRDIESRVTDSSERSRQIAALDGRFPLVMVMRDMEQPRQAHVLERGQYHSPKEAVSPGLPASIGPEPNGEVKNRLDLARWLVSGRHPLTARVQVNRLWEQLFGTGIVASSENLGVQADWPSHPDLLDWLAVEFVESGWDAKRLLKMMVMSSTYRQSGATDAERLRRDPSNKRLSRGPRVRLQAEMVRDQALAISGLLVEHLGGPSVWTYQPAGLWKEVEKRGTFVQDHGDKLYRRSLYSRIRRTVAPPSMLLFDLPSREVCAVKRQRTNTPLQALALMNEVTYVEAAKKFAERMMLAAGDAEGRINWGFRCATCRPPEADELQLLVDGYERRLALFQRDPERAENLLNQGESKVSGELDRIELAALTTVANVILNLDELINK